MIYIAIFSADGNNMWLFFCFELVLPPISVSISWILSIHNSDFDVDLSKQQEKSKSAIMIKVSQQFAQELLHTVIKVG